MRKDPEQDGKNPESSEDKDTDSDKAFDDGGACVNLYDAFFKYADRRFRSAVVTQWQIPRPTWLAKRLTDPRYILAAIVRASPSHYGQKLPRSGTTSAHRDHTYQTADTPYVFATADAASKEAAQPDPERIASFYFVTIATETAETQLPARVASGAKTHG